MPANQMPRVTHFGRDTCNGSCETNAGCNCAGLGDCATEGGEHRDPAPTKPQPGLGLLIVALGWPVVLVVICAIVVIVLNMPRISV